MFLASKLVTYMVQLIPEVLISLLIRIKIKFMMPDRWSHACQLQCRADEDSENLLSLKGKSVAIN